MLAAAFSGVERATAAGQEIVAVLPSSVTLKSRVHSGALQRTLSTLLFAAMLSPTIAAAWRLSGCFDWTRRLHAVANLAAVAIALPVVGVLGLLVAAGCQTLAHAIALRAFVQRVAVQVEEKRRWLRYRWLQSSQRFELDPSRHEIVVESLASGHRAVLPVTASQWQQLASASRLDAWCSPGAEQPFVLHQTHLQNPWSPDLTSPAAVISFAWFGIVQVLFGTMLVFTWSAIRSFAHL
ncbi:MAG: hypothetical protein U1E76_01295 [Planctomycetota bacterium]